MELVRALYFTDVLCIWAYVNQIRIDELEAEFGSEVVVEPLFCSVFGNVPGKLEQSWAERGGSEGYARHVRSVVERYPHVQVHPETWARVTPNSSMPAHLFLCAVRRVEQDGRTSRGSYARACRAIREAFFDQAEDVSQERVLFAIAAALGIEGALVRQRLTSGQAHAELARRGELAKRYDVQVSPSLVLNEGRQRLNGNVGFRVIDANVRELLHRPASHEASWC
jgi:predicted DsbA family dithiol-disulfide isomerase